MRLANRAKALVRADDTIQQCAAAPLGARDQEYARNVVRWTTPTDVTWEMSVRHGDMMP